ncbi:M14 family metallopeptidase [Neobacillus sp. OS1-32]|uniref:M14 family metallopeptidase n=1 Tax=Neobacillus sp. OS1-32 TaxID=3070682 RepID=UPI0027DF48C2|nr:M14 family metallopeptidase [Neobacillus sp. OS1-32]WML29300.1 M14 family metallopeptidase [Neobacillus sp. OS1-32]
MEITVRHGDSLSYYSQLFTISLPLIIDSNPKLHLDQLPIGQKIIIPGFMVKDYQIQQNDTISTIAQKQNLPLDGLYLVNPEINPDHLQTGQTIHIPQRITERVVQGKQNYDYRVLKKDLKRLQQIYPFIRVSAIGQSVLGREIPEVRIGNGDKKIHYNGSFHANEWITTAVLLTCLNDYLLSLTNQTPMGGVETPRLYTETSLSLVPMVNPDGVNLVLHGLPDNERWRTRVLELNQGSLDFTGWKANINGVDLNDQFPANWEGERARNQKQPGPRDYGGKKPLTEPEAIAMAELTRQRDFSKVLAFHTQGEEMYWGFENLEPPESETIVQEFSRVSGYAPVKNIESYAGYKDWFIQEWRRPGFTIELGNGVNPLPLEQFDKIQQQALGIFLAGLCM